ncbi:hypothetical protein [[Scytonema hofmanni] UTEX B 1581]|uniref:hypothetical protein n=1 Tax=[Scytonema hofmanni] UTEX B 1581 TaxID=379535 RepID=UPI00118341C1|nr:hypothetical protein [[Scytonema hofmanni] UTEX B 1581]
MTSRYRGGDAFTPAPGGRVLRPHGHSVVMVLMACASFTKPAILEITTHFDRTNRTYLPLFSWFTDVSDARYGFLAVGGDGLEEYRRWRWRSLS